MRKSITLTPESQKALTAAMLDYGQACHDLGARRPLEPTLEEIVKRRASAWTRVLDALYAEPAPLPDLRPRGPLPAAPSDRKGPASYESIHAPGAAARAVQRAVDDAGSSARRRLFQESCEPLEGEPVSPCHGKRVAMKLSDEQHAEEFPICVFCRKEVPYTDEIAAWLDGKAQAEKTGAATAARVGDHLGTGIDVQA